RTARKSCDRNLIAILRNVYAYAMQCNAMRGVRHRKMQKNAMHEQLKMGKSDKPGD
ncbi:hypothetical protein FRB91_003018, partial [Serendipita sp. 411]